MKKNIVLIFVCFFATCTRFDSNKLNKELIQGKWQQVETISLIDDSLLIEKWRNTTLLTFTGDSCLEEMRDLQETTTYIYDIKDYFLSLEEIEQPINYLEINKLTKDSLILNTETRILRYIRKAE